MGALSSVFPFAIPTSCFSGENFLSSVSVLFVRDLASDRLSFVRREIAVSVLVSLLVEFVSFSIPARGGSSNFSDFGCSWGFDGVVWTGTGRYVFSNSPSAGMEPRGLPPFRLCFTAFNLEHCSVGNGSRITYVICADCRDQVQ